MYSNATSCELFEFRYLDNIIEDVSRKYLEDTATV